MIFFWVPPNDISASGGGGVNIEKTVDEKKSKGKICDRGYFVA